MAKILDILSIEKERSDVDAIRTIHLFQEGSFYRAYEWSAWLCHRYIYQFKVTHKHLKNIEESVLFIGFPVSSIEKYTPKDAIVNKVDEKELVIQLLIDDGMSIDIMQTDYQMWKSSIPIQTSQNAEYKSPAKVKPLIAESQQMSITGIMQQILAFPLENRTPMQCMTFIAETKQQLACLI